MKKTSKYSNKRRVTGRSFNGAQWLNTIQRSRTYTDEPIPGSTLEGTMTAALGADLRVQDAFAALSHHQKPIDPEMTMDLLAHGLGVAVIRSRQIHPDLETNPVMPSFAPPPMACSAPSIAGKPARRGVWTALVAKPWSRRWKSTPRSCATVRPLRC